MTILDALELAAVVLILAIAVSLAITVIGAAANAIGRQR